MRKNCTILMMRFPEKGKVKTRLAARIGDERSLEVYLALLQDTIDAIDSSGTDTVLSVYGKVTGAVDLPESFSEKGRISQIGDDLGERQFNSLRAAYTLGYKKAVVIAGDSPEISADGINDAFRYIDDADAVIGPCFDGGYYLLGVKPSKLHPEIFQGITWGVDSVSMELKGNLRAMRLSYHEIGPLHDIDTFEDLASFIERVASREAPHTYRAVSKLLREEDLRP